MILTIDRQKRLFDTLSDNDQTAVLYMICAYRQSDELIAKACIHPCVVHRHLLYITVKIIEFFFCFRIEELIILEYISLALFKYLA